MIGCARVLAVVAAAGVMAAGCAGSPDPVPSAAPGSPIDVVIADGSVTPTGDRVEVEAGEPVSLRIDSDAVDEIHVHSDPEHEFAVEPGDDQTFTFTVDVPGQVAVESHGLDRTIVQLLVR